jgi:L-threonylcarbamoyladenylate synthase
MLTEIFTVDATAPDATSIAHAADILRGGGLVAFPTETVYGLGANALDNRAVAGIFAAKGRPSHNPIIVHVAGLAEACKVTTEWPDAAQLLAERFWPGPLTMVLPKSTAVADLVTAGGPTVAVRVPAHPVALALLRATALPLAAPSANRSAGLSPTLAEHVVADLEGRIAMVLDAGPTPRGIESTVLDLTVSPPHLLRPGPISPAALEALIGPLARPECGPQSGPLRSPGLLSRHYAPRTTLECAADGWPRVQELRRAGLRVGWLSYGEPPRQLETEEGVILAMPRGPAAYAAELYNALHILDAAGLDRIVVGLPPVGEAWLAIHDRLQRAGSAKP